MRLIASGFFLGTFLLQFFSYLPNKAVLFSFLFALFLLIIIICRLTFFSSSKSIIKPLLVFLFSGLLSLTYASITAQSIIDTRLHSELVGKDLVVEGVIANIPQQQHKRWRFYFDVSGAKIALSKDQVGESVSLKGRIKLSLYHRKTIELKKLIAGQKWRFRVRLKQPSGFMNQGGFDYEKWLFTNRIRATGYVRYSAQNIVLKSPPWYSLHYQRQQIAYKINQLLAKDSSHNMHAIISALAVASRDEMSESQWELFRHTGTSHLMAISGLHIGIVAGFGYLLIAAFWWLFPALYQKIPVRIAGAFLAITLATIYAFLAGFTLPTQRSLVMVVGVVIALLQRQRVMTLNIIAIALIIILLIDPFATMSASFWLSFTAVLLILLYSHRRWKKSSFSFLSLQFMLSFGMFPLTIFFFGSASLISPIANLIAIPWVTVIIVPLILLAMVSLLIAPILSQTLLQFVALNIDYLMRVLGWLDSFPFIMLDLQALPTILILVMMLSLFFLFLPRGFPGKWLGVLLLIPVFSHQPQSVQQGAFVYTMLDVGQGLASVIQTKHHVLVYDTGPKANENFDTGRLVVLPFLQSRGIDHLDKMVLSHEDMDHRGGTLSVLKIIKADEIISSNKQFLKNYPITICQAGLQWQWDGVMFEFLHPNREDLLTGELSDNNHSCVLRITNQYHRLLLTGDIEKEVELSLLENQRDKLKSEVLLIPHHGSATSSTDRFIDAVDPKLVLNSVGYHNKFKHPAEKVMQRYQQRGIPIFDNVKKGEIRLLFPADNKSLMLKSYREDNLKFWHRNEN
ncbi:MAG TPA: DNA internalization-related competence protein ComEC/Rec2 [Leucothrix mucor]|uniref:DNA internalization-related competence protein ComEC/Rec2 n=1 Tax=Leucothrix mucor TaxID=45248 RepID=A0A7V2WTL7_LEUMU|nr:DNA internalization-related competence protein ComEC/Rec2 [Leucothrix mucor]